MSEDEVAAALALRKLGRSYGEVARTLGVHINTLRSHIDYDYWQLCHANMEKMRLRNLRLSLRKARAVDSLENRDLTARFFGDPPYERSALYARQHGIA